MTEPSPVNILIVDDEQAVLETFERWLEDEYEVYTAIDGNEALDILESNGIDIVILDRRMPGLSGDEVLERITELDIDCQVAMVTAVEPDLNIVEMGFDEYMVKPPTYDEFHETIENLLERRDHSTTRQEFYSLLSKRNILEQEIESAQLADSEEYKALVQRIEDKKSELAATQDHMGEDIAFVSAMREIEGR